MQTGINSGIKSGPSLPRGLWVGKRRRPETQWADPETPEYYEEYWFRFRKAGMPQQFRTTNTANLKEAVGRAKLVYEAQMSDKWEQLRGAIEKTRSRRVVCTIGEIIKAFRDPGMVIMKDVQRPVTSLRLLIAGAKGWRVPFSRIDEESELARRIDALPADVLTQELVFDFLRDCQGGGELRLNVVDRRNLTWNKTVLNARLIFGKRPLAVKLQHLSLPEDLSGFLKAPLLKEGSIDLEAEMISPEDYRAMVEASGALLRSADPMDRELALVNTMLRRLGLRSGELVAARDTWLWRSPQNGRWYLDIKHRPEEGYQMKGAEPGRLPLGDDLLALLRDRKGHLILPKATDGAREKLITKGHNAWMKKIVGEGYNRQGNHRLRKYVATMLAEQKGADVAAHYLRHTKEAVTLRNYIARRTERLEVVSDADLMTWNAETSPLNAAVKAG